MYLMRTHFSCRINLLIIVKEYLCEFDFGVSILALYYKYSYFGCILKYLLNIQSFILHFS